MFRFSNIVWVAVLAGFLALSAPRAWSDDFKEGRYKVYRVSGPPVTGFVRKLPNAYEVEVRAGITMKIPVTQVRKLEPLDEVATETIELTALGGVSDEDIQSILGSGEIELSAVDGREHVDLESPLTLDRDSLQEMMSAARTAGRQAQYYPTDHFVFVYTSDEAKVRALAARLEPIYEWCAKYVAQLEIPVERPEHKLEIFFFGHFDEFLAYRTLKGQSGHNVLGNYFPDEHRSAFFDVETFWTIERDLKRAEDKSLPIQERRRIRNEALRKAEALNLEVVQHEAAHHIHFGFGIFPRVGEWIPWTVEGLATMFEVPPSEAGASLGAINHARLGEFRRAYGEKGERATWEYVRGVILGQNDDGYLSRYVMGWAMHHYLYFKQRDKYAKYMQALADRAYRWTTHFGGLITGQDTDATARQAEFETIFGEINEAWVKSFLEHIASLRYRPSLDNR